MPILGLGPDLSFMFFDQPRFFIWQHIKMYRWIKIHPHFPIKYDSLQIVTQPVTAGIHRAWIIHVQAGSAVKAQPSRTVFMKITPQPQSYLLVQRSPLWMWWEDFCPSAKLCLPFRELSQWKLLLVRELLPSRSWAPHTQRSCLMFKY